MERIFLNFSNHPSCQWTEKQLEATKKYGRIEDMPFPEVEPTASKEEVIRLSEKIVKIIVQKKPHAVLCQGEFCLAYQVIRSLKEEGLCVVAACSKRMVREEAGEKHILFRFEQFREY